MKYTQQQLNNALFQASKLGLTKAVVKLLELGADPKVYGSRALILAAENGHTEVVKLLEPYS
jgi:ankyrin repeat protein